MNNPKSHSPKGAPAGTALFGGPIPCFSIRLDVAADDLKPDEITTLLGVAPTTAWEKGTTFLNRDGSVRRTTKSGRWSLSLQPSETEEWDAGVALNLMVSRLRADEDVWRDIASRAVISLSVCVFLENANQGVSLEPALLRWLADRNITLEFDIHTAEETELEGFVLVGAPGPGSTH